jgi:hypothetical protein
LLPGIWRAGRRPLSRQIHARRAGPPAIRARLARGTLTVAARTATRGSYW